MGGVFEGGGDTPMHTMPLPNYLKKFRDCFSDIGYLLGKHHIVIDTNHPPDVNPLRRIPYALRKKLKTNSTRWSKLK